MKNEFFHNTLREKMKQRPVFGITIYTKSPQIIEVLGYQGFDFAFIDAEHCPWEVTDLAEAVLAARLAGEGERTGEFLLMTGPSRTADIEKILILGVHGPKKVVVYIIENE